MYDIATHSQFDDTDDPVTGETMENGNTPSMPRWTQIPMHFLIGCCKSSFKFCYLKLRLLEMLVKIRAYLYTIRPWKTSSQGNSALTMSMKRNWSWSRWDDLWKCPISFFSSSIKRLRSYAVAGSTWASSRWSGNRNGALSHLYSMIFVILFLQNRFAHGCSTRSTPKPKPISPSVRPNITIRTFTCPQEYDAHYCLNGATCFTVKIGESILYNCECSDGYMGQRCEFKDLDGSYYPSASKQRALLEQAGITSVVVFIIIFVVLLLTSLYLRARGTRAQTHTHTQRGKYRSLGTLYGACNEENFGNRNPKMAIATAMLIKRPFSA